MLNCRSPDKGADVVEEPNQRVSKRKLKHYWALCIIDKLDHDSKANIKSKRQKPLEAGSIESILNIFNAYAGTLPRRQ